MTWRERFFCEAVPLEGRVLAWDFNGGYIFRAEQTPFSLLGMFNMKISSGRGLPSNGFFRGISGLMRDMNVGAGSGEGMNKEKG